MNGKLKIFLGYTVAPLLVGFLLGVIFNVTSFASFVEDPRRMAQMRPGEGIIAMFMYPLLCEVVLLVPSLLTALTVIVARLQRTLSGCLVAGCMGGALGLLWCFGILGWLMDGKDYNLLPSLMGGLAIFTLTGLVSGIVGCLVLPRSPSAFQPAK